MLSWSEGDTAPPLNCPDGSKAITPEENALFGSLFQPPPELDNEHGVDPVFPNFNPSRKSVNLGQPAADRGDLGRFCMGRSRLERIVEIQAWITQ